MNTNNNNPAVCILSAGKGGRLEALTSKINKALLPIGNKPVISFIIEKIPENSDIVLSVGYQKESLIEFCEAAYPERNFIFIDNPDYESARTGPATGLLLCKKYLQRPFYFCCNDCIVDEEFCGLDSNWLGVQKTSKPEIYSTAKLDKNGNIIDFQNKSPDGYEWAFIGLAGIKDYEKFWEKLDSTYSAGDTELVAAFYNPEIYSSFKAVEYTWHDTGNIEAYENTVSLLSSRANIKKKLMNLHT